MSPNGRRAWRRAAKKLRREMGRRWRSQKEWLYGKRWSEFVPDLEAHRSHITGAWFKRHGFTEQCQTLDPVRVYIGLWGTADGDGVEYVVHSKPCTPRSLVGRTNGARKRKARYWMECERLHQKAQDFQEVVDRSVGRKSSLRTIGHTPISLRNHYRIGERLRPCPGCFDCAIECWVCHAPHEPPDELCGGSGVIRAGKLRPHLRKPDCGFYID